MSSIKTILYVLLVALLFAGCLKNDNTPGSEKPGPGEVWMQNRKFVPSKITVNAGTTVTWINKDSIQYNVIDSGYFESGTIYPDEIFSFEFDSGGTFEYVCTFHPGMAGTVIVEAFK